MDEAGNVSAICTSVVHAIQYRLRLVWLDTSFKHGHVMEIGATARLKVTSHRLSQGSG